MQAVVCQKENVARFVELYNQIGLEDPFTGQRSVKDFQRDYGKEFQRQVLLVKLAEQDIGFLFWSEQRGGVVTIEQLFLLPEYREQGYEEELLSQLIQLYRNSGKKAIQSMLSAPDLATGDCYRRLEFHETGQNIQLILPVTDCRQDLAEVDNSLQGVQIKLAEREEWQQAREVYRGLALEDERYQLRSWSEVKTGSNPERGKGCFLLTEGTDPIGLLTMNLYPVYENGQTRNIGQIYELGLVPKARGLGIGPKLLAAGLAWGQENDVEEFRMNLNGFHRSGVQFMQVQGFQIKRVVSSFTYLFL